VTVKQQEAIDAAVTKARNDTQLPDSSLTNEATAKRHAEELKLLEERLKAAHKAEMDAAARQAASASASASTTVSEEAQKAAIEAALNAAKLEWTKAQEQALEQAVDRGRMEQAVKARIKDAQLLKSQGRVKELEAQLMELQPSSQNVAGTSAPSPTTTSNPQVPPAVLAAQPKPLGRGAAPATRGRGAARTLGGRGGAPATPAAPVVATAQPTGGVSIMGAAKRPREEGESEPVPPDNSLAKRLKPAEAKPVPIRRPPVPKPQ
jgi:nucleoprotein TPR